MPPAIERQTVTSQRTSLIDTPGFQGSGAASAGTGRVGRLQAAGRAADAPCLYASPGVAAAAEGIQIRARNVLRVEEDVHPTRRQARGNRLGGPKALAERETHERMTR